MIQVQIRRLPGLGDFQTLPGNVYAQSQLKPSPLMQLPDIWGHANPLPETTTPPPSAPGAILPTQAPTYLFPTTTPAETPQPVAEGKGIDTKTLLIGGGIIALGILAFSFIGD